MLSSSSLTVSGLLASVAVALAATAGGSPQVEHGTAPHAVAAQHTTNAAGVFR